MLKPSIVSILCCPETRQALGPADPSLIARLNESVGRGTLKNRAGKPVTTRLDAGLIRSDGRFLYPVRNEIPVLLVDEGIPLD